MHDVVDDVRGVCFWRVDREGVVMHDVVDDVPLSSVFVSL